MTDILKTLELPCRLERGEVRFSIDLALIDDVPALYRLLNTLGFAKPEIVIVNFPHSPAVHLLLHRQVYRELYEPPHELYEREQEALANAINTDAMHFCCGLMRPVEAA